MNTRLSALRWGSTAALVAYGCAFLIPLYDVLLAPGQWLLGAGLDGCKNYLTLCWFLDHDSGLDFTGFNFPFGYHYLLTDGHAPLGWLLKSFGVAGADAVGILNVLLLLSLPVTAWLYFQWFKTLGVHVLAALLLGAAMVYLSPQWPRLNGHYALSYMWGFPLLALMLRRWKRSPYTWMWSGAAAVLVFFMYALHPYLGLMLSVQSAVFGFPVLLRRGWKYGALQGLLVLGLPVVAFKCLMLGAGESLAPGGRPWGFWSYQSTWDAYLWPHQDVLKPHVTQFLDRGAVIDAEGRAFLGWGNLLLIASAVGVSVWRRRLKHGWLLVLGVLSFAVSLGVPFEQWYGFYEYGGPIREFRTLGRFSWLAVFGLVSWGTLAVFARPMRPVWAVGMAGLVLGASFWEGLDYRAKVTGHFEPVAHIWADVDSALASVDVHADAVVPYPFVYMGCDHYSPHHFDKHLLMQTLKTTTATGIPTLTNSGSRQDPQRVRSLSSISSPLGVDHTLRTALEGTATLLVVTRTWDAPFLRKIQGSREVGRFGEFAYFTIPTRHYQGAHRDPVLVARTNAMMGPGLTMHHERSRAAIPADGRLDRPGQYDVIVGHRCRTNNPLSGGVLVERMSDHKWLHGKAFTESIGCREDGFQFNRLQFTLDSADVPARIFYSLDPKYPGYIHFLEPSIHYRPSEVRN